MIIQRANLLTYKCSYINPHTGVNIINEVRLFSISISLSRMCNDENLYNYIGCVTAFYLCNLPPA